MCEHVSYSYFVRSWHQKTNPLRKKIFHWVENVIKQLDHTSAVCLLRYEALEKFGEYSRSLSCSWLCLKQLSCIFHALQTSCMLHISMNACWSINQLLIMSQNLCIFTSPWCLTHHSSMASKTEFGWWITKSGAFN